MDTDNYKHDGENTGDVTCRLWRLQNELDNLENKLSKTVLSLQSLLDEEEKGPEVINETVYETKSQTSTSKLEEKLHQRSDIMNETVYETKGQTSTGKQEETLHHRSSGVHKATEDRMVNSVGANFFNKAGDKTSDSFRKDNDTWKTCDYWSLPRWLQVNDFILKGYRPPLPSLQTCFSSIFRMHTETLNIWTHLLGCLLFMVLFLHASLSSLPLQDKLVLTPFFVGAIICMGFSSLFHTVQCYSETVLTRTSLLDYCGINMLIVGSFVPYMYYGFFCDLRLKILYLAGVFSLGICSAIVSLSKTFSEPTYHPLRAAVFVVFGLSGVVPGIHFVLLEGFQTFFEFALPLLISSVLYIAGAFIYAVRVPERFFPGKCDILFQSHQFFHVLVVLATLTNYIGIFRVATFAQFGRDDPNFCRQREFYYTNLVSS